jgi:hypothetical protein
VVDGWRCDGNTVYQRDHDTHGKGAFCLGCQLDASGAPFTRYGRVCPEF